LKQSHDSAIPKRKLEWILKYCSGSNGNRKILFSQLFSKSELREGTKTFVDAKFFSVFRQISEIRI